MKLNVPFLYEAQVIKPRCRNPSLLIVRDDVEVDICETDISDLPVAFKVGDQSIRWDGNRLWRFDKHGIRDQEPHKVLYATVEANTTAGRYKWSNPGSEAPFNNFWSGITPRHVGRIRTMQAQLDDVGVIRRTESKYREWVNDNRDEVVAKAHEIAANLLICEGYMCVPAGEPFYYVNTFGLSNNHGGTAMFIGSCERGSIPESRYFNAFGYDKACKYGNEVALNRNDTQSLPVTPNCGNKIEVLIPDAVQLPSTNVGKVKPVNETENNANLKSVFSLIYAERPIRSDALITVNGVTIHNSMIEAIREVSVYVYNRIVDCFLDEFKEWAKEEYEYFNFDDIKGSMSDNNVEEIVNWYFKQANDDECVEAFYKIQEHKVEVAQN
jgi:hypothetical protein